MSGSSPRLAAVLFPSVAIAVVALAAVALWSDISPEERLAAATMLTQPRVGLLVLFGIVLVGALGFLAYRSLIPVVREGRQLAEAVRLIAHGNASHRVPSAALPGLRDVAEAVNELAAERARLLVDVEKAVADAKTWVEEERSRLAALIAELDQSVLVCNRDGRVLLYNAAAQRLLGGEEHGGSELLGLGRSVFAVLDRAVVLHAVEALEEQAARDANEGVHFVTATPDGRLLRVRAAGVQSRADDAGAGPEIGGYVLLLSDVTADVAVDDRRVTLFQGLVEATRASLANIRAAIENLTQNPDMDGALRTRFATIILDEAVGLSDRLHDAAAEVTQGLKTRWPLEEMRGEDLLTLVQRRIERRTGISTKLETVDRDLWLSVDSFTLAQALTYIAHRLKEASGVREVRFRLTKSGGHARLDLVWQGAPLSSETAFGWQTDAFSMGGEDSPLNLEQAMERHRGEAWYQRDVPTQTAYFRLLLPLAERRPDGHRRSAAAGRPEFYDFNLFRRSAATDALDERRLADLAYTVFDTETTGLDPAQGDEIISIGAVRILNGRLLPSETFESLVDPGRSLSETSVAVHGITAGMLRGQPAIGDVLRRFRKFAEETVLVGHNAAFDMRFLELKEAQIAVRFDQPVLDTLLLSAVVHPAQASHGLEEIAGRLGVEVIGRHTALGDALVTAEVFLRLLPLLAQRGICTLGQARAASEKTFYARLKY
jgi:DNA polymerase III subunit epsilon